LIPPSLLAGRWVVVLVCYLDDSGKDPQNPISTIAGFVARSDEWKAFEEKVEPVFGAYCVKILHTMDLYHTAGEFDGWRRVKKQTFVSEICQAMSPHVPMGMSMSAQKVAYKGRAEESNRKRTSTPYSFCFQVILDWILRDVRVGRLANTEGVAFILEAGHENNGDAERDFYALRKQHKLEALLPSISFVGKEQCRAIQAADMLAFYSRRHGVALEKATIEDRRNISSPMMDIINHHVPVRAFVATDFGPDAPGSRFYAGDPE
jgi:hypothetical protein